MTKKIITITIDSDLNRKFHSHKSKRGQRMMNKISFFLDEKNESKSEKFQMVEGLNWIKK